MLYTQCELRKDNRVDVAWIPDIYATVGKCLVIQDEDGWIVTSVFENSTSEYEEVNFNSRDWARTRKYSDR